jgi:hypothetical protein
MHRSIAPVAAAASFTLLAALAAAPASAAEEGGAKEEPFGKAGVINVASDLSLSVQSTSFSAPSGEKAPDSVTTFAIGPAADVFVIDNFSVGAALLFGKTAFGPDVTQTTIGAAPRIGYHVPLVPERLGLWPRLEFGYASVKTKATGAPDTTEKTLALGLFVPLLIHPVEHFHIGIGPFIDTDLSATEDGKDSLKQTTIGLRTEIAGWWQL